MNREMLENINYGKGCMVILYWRGFKVLNIIKKGIV